MSEGRRVEIAVCERHGLKYNAAEGQGCVRCRREAGLGAPPAGATRSAVASATPSGASSGVSSGVSKGGSDRPASAPVQLLLAALLVGGTGAMFWAAHQQVLSSFGALGAAAGAPGALGDGVGLDDGLAYGEPYEDGGDPAAHPPGDTVAVGPAAQDQQMRELMRQMDDDARADARAAAESAAHAAEQEPDAYDAYEPE
jgi:hypothetical protein